MKYKEFRKMNIFLTGGSGLLKAGKFVKTIQTRYCLYLACIEEIAFIEKNI